MDIDHSKIDFHKFADDELLKRDLKCVQITQDVINRRLPDIMSFYNNITNEYKESYGWKAEDERYFLNGLKDKFKYSFAFIDMNDKIVFMNFSSLYDGILHYHFSFTHKNYRSKNLAKIHAVKVSQTAIDNGIEQMEGYWPKNNNGSLILYLSLGFEIQSIRYDKEVFLRADVYKVRNRAFDLINISVNKAV